jgi:hypothetical protein
MTVVQDHLWRPPGGSTSGFPRLVRKDKRTALFVLRLPEQLCLPDPKTRKGWTEQRRILTSCLSVRALRADPWGALGDVYTFDGSHSFVRYSDLQPLWVDIDCHHTPPQSEPGCVDLAVRVRGCVPYSSHAEGGPLCLLFSLDTAGIPGCADAMLVALSPFFISQQAPVCVDEHTGSIRRRQSTTALVRPREKPASRRDQGATRSAAQEVLELRLAMALVGEHPWIRQHQPPRPCLVPPSMPAPGSVLGRRRGADGGSSTPSTTSTATDDWIPIQVGGVALYTTPMPVARDHESGLGRASKRERQAELESAASPPNELWNSSTSCPKRVKCWTPSRAPLPSPAPPWMASPVPNKWALPVVNLDGPPPSMSTCPSARVALTPGLGGRTPQCPTVRPQE